MEVKNSQVTKTPNQTEIQSWMIDYLAELLEIEPEKIDPTIPFDRYGLESADAYAMTGDLESWLNQEIDATAIYDYPTIEALAEHLSSN